MAAERIGASHRDDPEDGRWPCDGGDESLQDFVHGTVSTTSKKAFRPVDDGSTSLLCRGAWTGRRNHGGHVTFSAQVVAYLLKLRGPRGVTGAGGGVVNQGCMHLSGLYEAADALMNRVRGDTIPRLTTPAILS